MVLKILVPIISSVVISLAIGIMSLPDDKITYWEELFMDEKLYSQGENLHEEYLAIKDSYTKGIISNEEFVSELKQLRPKVETHTKDLEDQIFFLRANHHYMAAKNLLEYITKDIDIFSSS